MPLANRVSPFGELLAAPDRGPVYGNRGCLHDAQGRIRRAYASRRWIACRLSFQRWQRTPLMQPGRLTELFFLDEATALAAAHRPCALCRRTDYDEIVRRWADQHPGETSADMIDRRLHAERLDPARRCRLHARPADDLPDGIFVARGPDAGCPQRVPPSLDPGRLRRGGGATERRPRGRTHPAEPADHARRRR
jgi:hypothetical protein